MKLRNSLKLCVALIISLFYINITSLIEEWRRANAWKMITDSERQQEVKVVMGRVTIAAPCFWNGLHMPITPQV